MLKFKRKFRRLKVKTSSEAPPGLLYNEEPRSFPLVTQSANGFEQPHLSGTEFTAIFLLQLCACIACYGITFTFKHFTIHYWPLIRRCSPVRDINTNINRIRNRENTMWQLRTLGWTVLSVRHWFVTSCTLVKWSSVASLKDPQHHSAKDTILSRTLD